MAAASRAPRVSAATTVGLLPGSDRAEANQYVTVAIPTGLGELRNGLIVRAADAVVAVGGAYGTLSEVALALRTGVPVVGLDTWAIDGIEPAPTASAAADARSSTLGRTPERRLHWVARPMPTFKPVYLIHGDDHGRIAERRARLRALAEAESGTEGTEVFESDTATPEAVAAALNAMTFALGRRFIIVEGAERWKEKELGPVTDALAHMPPDTTVVFFAREDSRTKAPNGLHEAVAKAGGRSIPSRRSSRGSSPSG